MYLKELAKVNQILWYMYLILTPDSGGRDVIKYEKYKYRSKIILSIGAK